jgi:toxin ParE1/3/4
MAFQVLLTAEAAGDLQEIAVWIAQNDVPERAHEVVDRIEMAIAALGKFPHRGAHPPELLALGVREYRETSFKPYRIVYHVEGKRVYVDLIADGRRDMQALLARRLLEG